MSFFKLTLALSIISFIIDGALYYIEPSTAHLSVFLVTLIVFGTSAIEVYEDSKSS